MRVLVVEAIAPEGLAYLREHGVDVDELAKASPAELRARLPDYEGLITRSGTAVTAELLDHAPRLRIVGRAGVGVDNVDVEACSRRGIVVCNAPYGNVVSAAEHTLGMLLREADVVTFHVPLTPETENMVAARELARMKRGVRLVNCARGGIVNEADLLAALESEHVAGVAIDVWSEEPPAGEPLRRLIQHPRVVVTPHLGANSGEAQVNVAVDVARQLVAFRDGGLVEHAVNIPLGDPAAVAELRPFVALADRLGRFSVQLDPEPLERLEVTLAGAIAEADPELLARAVLAGLLAPVMAGPVNLVNARLVAAERGVEVHVTRETETAGYTSVLTITTHTRGGRKIIAGTVFDGQPRIVRLRDLDIEFTPEGHILVLSYEDRPGMVGKIGSILGRQNVNIASMHVGRREKRGRAIVVLILDEDLVPEQLREVARAVKAARLVYRSRLEPGSLGTALRATLEANGWRHVSSTSVEDRGTTQIYEKAGSSLEVRVWEGLFGFFTYVEVTASRALPPSSAPR